MPNRDGLERIVIERTSIFGGMQDVYHTPSDDEYLFGIGIDPELELGTPQTPSGIIASTRFEKKSTNAIMSGAPMWMTGAPTSAAIYVYDQSGSVTSYSVTLASETNLGSPDGTPEGNGLVAWNDYLYASTGTSVSRRQISASGASWGEYWVTTLGMSTLTDSTYPGTRSIKYPNHVLHQHSDGFVYVADYDGANGRIHAFKTDADGTNGSGEWDILPLPPGMMPTDIESFGTSLAILLIPDGRYVGAIPVPGEATMVLWDTVRGNRFYQEAPVKEPIATALINKKGTLFCLAGNFDTNVRLLEYLGGDAWTTVDNVNEGSPPPAGAVDTNGNMIAYGAYVSYPTVLAGVRTYGHRSNRLPSNARHMIARISGGVALPIVTALKFLQRNDFPVIGWSSDGLDNEGIDALGGSNAYTTIFMDAVQQIGREFVLREVDIPLVAAVGANMSAVVRVVTDNDEATVTVETINDTNYDNGEKVISLRGLSVRGSNNFYLRIDNEGTVAVNPSLPIRYKVDVYA